MAENRVHELLTGLMVAIKSNKLEKKPPKERDTSIYHEVKEAEVIIYTREPRGDFDLAFLSDNVFSQLGFQPEEFTRAPRMWFDLIHPDDADSVKTALNDLSVEKHCVQEFRFRHKDETYRWIRDERNLIVNNGVPSEILGTWIDITERKRVEKALRENEARYRSLCDNSPVGMISFDMNGDITEFNPAVLNILGAQGEITDAQDLFSVLPLVETGISEAVLQCLESGESGVGEFQYKSKSDRQVYTRLHVVPIKGGDGKIAAAHAFVQDISDQKRAEELIVSSERLKVLGQISGGVGHNFSNLLQIVSGNVNMAITNLDLQEYDSVRQCLDEILEGTRSATEVVRWLLQFGRARFQKAPTKKDIFDVSSLVEEAVEICKLWSKLDLDRKNLHVIYDVSATSGCYVEGFRDQISWVLLNLLKNAVEALPFGGKIKIRTTVKNDMVVLSVRDNGVGIKDDEIKHIGTSFWSSKDSHAGTGLAFNCGILRQHGGTMGFKRLIPRGTTFMVRLPFVKDPSQKRKALASTVFDRGYTILLVDDEPPVVTMLEKGMRLLGQDPIPAHSGKEAVKIFRESRKIDAVVCDYAMNGLNGLEVAKSIAGICKARSILKPPFLILTGVANQLDEEEIAQGEVVDRILEKPIKIPKLLEVIHEEIVRLSSTASFTGRVEGIDLLEYTQLLLLNGQKAVLEVVSRQGVYGLLFVEEGNIRHAVCGELEGEDALYKCLTFNGGSFSSQPWRNPEKVTINKPGQFVLLEAARKRDEIKSAESGE
jgi:two-component system, cell cycle sensor histidine kinase and response regulator CckA